MDTFHAFVRRLVSVAIFCFFAGLFLCPSLVVAQTDNSFTAAESQCQTSEAAGNASSGAGTYTCVDIHNPPYCLWQLTRSSNGSSAGGWAYTCSDYQAPPPSNPCTSLTGFSGDFSYSPGSSLPTSVKQFVTDPSSGASVECDGTLTWSGNPTMDAYGHLHVQESVTWNTNPGTGNGAAGTSSYLDSSGSPMSPQPTVTNGASPQLCGGGSCYDPNANQFCATSGGSQFCVSGSVADSQQGGCVSSGGASLCAGSPTPPSPVGVSGSRVTNPATQIKSSDQYTQQSPTTGALQSVTVNTYQAPGGSVSSGSTSTSQPAANSASTSSSQPASSSSSGSSDSFGGGGDCNTPPVCQGDAVMCGVAQEAWHTSCNVTIQTTALVGSNPTQQPPTFASDQTKYSQSDVWVQSSGTGSTVGDAANSGTYDETGFGYSTTCPMVDLTVPIGSVGSFVIPFSKGCVIGPWIYWTVIAFSLYRAARITAGSAI